MADRRRVARIAVLVGVAVILTAGFARYGPAVAFTVALASPRVDDWLSAVTPRPVTEIVEVPGRVPLLADLHRPAGPPRQGGPGVVLVHGLSPAGRRQPDLVRLAQLLARHGQTVLVPDFQGLREFRLTGAEVADIRAAIEWLRDRARSVAVAGFSFGAGPAILAADQVHGLRWVGCFGGYADLANVARFILTGTHTFGAERHVQPVESYNRWKLAALLTAFVDDQGDRERFSALTARKLANPAEDTSALTQALGPEGQTMLRLVTSRTESEVSDGLAALSPQARTALASLSPLAAIGRLGVPILIAHGASDPSIPFTESLRLGEAAAPGTRPLILGTFHHTGPAAGAVALMDRVRDGVRLVALVDRMLRDGGYAARSPRSAGGSSSPARTPSSFITAFTPGAPRAITSAWRRAVSSSTEP